MATKTEFVLKADRPHGRTGGTHTFDPSQGAGGVRGNRRSAVGGMRVMTIHALDVARRIDRIFRGVVDTGGDKNGVGAELIELSLYIPGRHRPAMARKTILLFIRKI